MHPLTYEGSNFFRQRLVLSTLSGRPIVLDSFRDEGDEAGVNESEEALLRLLDRLTDGSTIVINETGTSIRFTPGLLLGGTLVFDCPLQRSVGFYLEPLLCLAPFCKRPLHVTLRGVTNDNIDNSVDALQSSSLAVLKRFIVRDDNLELKVVSRGMRPLGGGEVLFRCPVVGQVRPLRLLEPGKVRRVRGVAYCARVSPAFASRMVDAAKGILLRLLPDVYLYTDHLKGKHSGRSPGFGLSLVAETTAGVAYTGEACSRPSGEEDSGSTVPEDVARQAVHNLLEEIRRGGCVDSGNQSLACLLMALATKDVSKVKTGPLSPYTIRFLRHLEDFLQLRAKLETEAGETHKVVVTCVGLGFSNLSRTTS